MHVHRGFKILLNMYCVIYILELQPSNSCAGVFFWFEKSFHEWIEIEITHVLKLRVSTFWCDCICQTATVSVCLVEDSTTEAAAIHVEGTCGPSSLDLPCHVEESVATVSECVVVQGTQVVAGVASCTVEKVPHSPLDSETETSLVSMLSLYNGITGWNYAIMHLELSCL